MLIERVIGTPTSVEILTYLMKLINEVDPLSEVDTGTLYNPVT